ncbi:hypothetical protein SGPA1_40271 [Streptomyces misionensis JCM 4497]
MVAVRPRHQFQLREQHRLPAQPRQRHRHLRRHRHHGAQQPGLRHQRPGQRHRHLQPEVPGPVLAAVRHHHGRRQHAGAHRRAQPQLEPPDGRAARRLVRQRHQRHREHHQHHDHRQPVQRLRVRLRRRAGLPGAQCQRDRRDGAEHRHGRGPGGGAGGGHVQERHRDRRRRGRGVQLPVPGELRFLHPHRRRRQLRLVQHLVGLLHLAAARPGQSRARSQPQSRQGPSGDGDRLPGRLHARQGGGRRRQLVLGVGEQRLPAVPDGRPRFVVRGAPAGAEAAAVLGVGCPHPDRHRARQHRRFELLHRGRLPGLPFRSGHRQHRHGVPAERHEPAVPAAVGQRQHGLASRAVQRGGGLPHLLTP